MPHEINDQSKAVLRFKNGNVRKGRIRGFSEEASDILFVESNGGEESTITFEELKAIFFVKSFDGDSGYNETKYYGESSSLKQKVFVKFSDNESITGFVRDRTPWQKGFHLYSQKTHKTGFFVLPTDPQSNNIKAYVINTAVVDLTLVG